jgi:hypothetical protein
MRPSIEHINEKSTNIIIGQSSILNEKIIRVRFEEEEDISILLQYIQFCSQTHENTDLVVASDFAFIETCILRIMN